MVASRKEVGAMKRIMLKHMSLSRARRIVKDFAEKIGRHSANESLRHTIQRLKKELTKA